MTTVETRAPVRRHFTVDEYHRLGDVGIFANERVELIEGEIFAMSPIGELHAGGVNRANRLFNRRFGEVALIAIQNPIALGDESEPQPDVAVLRFREDFYRSGHPTAADVLLLLEVSDKTLRFDLEDKARLYARFGIPEYWVEDVNTATLIVHREPSPGGYRSVRALGREERVRPVSFPDQEIALDTLLA